MPDSNRTKSGMPSAEAYRQKALELCASANKTTDPFIRAELESLAFVYMRLADKTERMAAAAPDTPDPDNKLEEGDDPSTA
jgi:hypothetical protein